MPIDNTVQFNGHNSYRVTETVWCEPFGVEGKAYITQSFNAYATSALGAALRARTRFFAANGSITGTTDHSFSVAQVFGKLSLPLAVPVNSVLCQLSFIPSGTWWVAEPKSEEGQSSTPYNTNYAGQLSLITPNGAYLGMLTTSQIVVAGSLADPTESLYARLITINNNAITLSATSAAQGSRITTVEAGQITLSSGLDTITPKVTRLTSGGVYTGEVVADQITSGMLKSVGNVSWINMDNGQFSFASGKLAYNGTELAIVGTLETGTVGGSSIEISGYYVRWKQSTVDKAQIYLSTGSQELVVYFPSSGWKFNVGATVITRNIQPTADNVYICGGSGARWAAVYAANGVIQTSSRNSKHDIGDILTISARKQLAGLKKQYKKNVFVDDVGHAISGTTHEDLQGLLDRIADKLVTFTYDGPEGTRQLGIIADDFANDPEFGHIGETYTDEAGNITYGIKPLSVTMLVIAGYRNLRERLNTLEAKQREVHK